MTRRIPAALVALLFAAAPLFGQTVVRIKDDQGRTLIEFTVATGSVEVTHPGPVNPPPGPPPPPVNPPPVNPPNVGPVKHFIIVRDDRPGAMSAGQLAALRDPQLRAAVAARGWAWHVFEVSSVEVQQPPPTGKGYSRWLNNGNLTQAPNLTAPCVLFLDAQGKLVRGVPMAADTASIVANFGG
jgi:hypothetical protein